MPGDAPASGQRWTIALRNRIISHTDMNVHNIAWTLPGKQPGEGLTRSNKPPREPFSWEWAWRVFSAVRTTLEIARWVSEHR